MTEEKNTELKTKTEEVSKKDVPLLKRKSFLILLTVIIYTAVVVVVTVKIDRKIIAYQIQKGFEEAFSFDDVDFDIDFDDDVDFDDDIDFKDNTSKKKESTPSKKATVLEANQVVTKEGSYELSVTGFDIAKKILPPDTSGAYSYYEVKTDGHQYLDLKIDYKNLEASGISADEAASAKIKYAGKYEYTSFSVIEDGDGDFTYSNITEIAPLTVGKMHYLFDIPDEVANGTDSIVATISVKGNTYEFSIR